ncbi:MAG TPA: hypothetical protein VHC23_10155 [Jatrophihabitans sp.]|nr:hypothetical protein [Jatrophihabitans sp.]
MDADGAADGAGEGVYVLATSGMNSCTGTQSLLIPHATDPFWTPAGLYGPPTVTVTARPAAATASRSATVRFTATTADPARHVTGHTCRVDGGAAQPCSSPFTVTGLADGSHTVTIAAGDGAQAGSASVSWRVDTSRPAAALTAPTAVATTAGSVRLTWSGRDTGTGVARYQVRYQRAAYGGGFGAWSAPASWQRLTGRSLTASHLAAGYDYCWSVRAVDRAGNTGSWSPARCTAVALDDQSTTRSHGWRRTTGSAYYDRTATTTTRKGATLTRKHAAVDRVGVVVTTCAKCGEVAVYVGRTRIGVVNLHATHTHHRVVKLLSRFRLRSGTVRVKVLTAGRTVAIDGLVLSRT